MKPLTTTSSCLTAVCLYNYFSGLEDYFLVSWVMLSLTVLLYNMEENYV